MTENVSYEDMEPFENPNHLPLENLKLEVKTDGVVQHVNALHKVWASDRYILHYTSPNIYDDKGHEILGAKKQWIEIVNYMIDDLRWLLSRPFYRFWSNIVYNTSILDAVVSFLQEAPPFYALEDFPNCPDMRALLEKLRRYVLMLFTRLITNKQSHEEYMNKFFLGELLYTKYIFTVPIIFDLCQLYGRENKKVVNKILDCLFTLTPQYNADLERTVPCLIEALENVEVKFVSGSTYTNATVSLSNRNTSSKKLTLFNLEDMILYILDIISTITVFLKNYHPAVSIFHTKDFMDKILAIYENTIPEMYKILDKLACNDENMPKYMELKHRLDVTRIEILHLFRILIYEPIVSIQATLNAIEEAEIKKNVDEYLHLLTNAISEKEFITDYVQFYPVETDLNILSNMCPEVDAMKRTYILQSISATIGKPCASSTISSSIINGDAPGPSGISNRTTAYDHTNSSNKKQTPLRDSVNLPSLISEIKDILHDLDEQFIKRCLEHYDYNAADVINAVLVDSVPPELKDMPLKMPSPPPSYQGDIDYADLARGVRALNIPDRDGNLRVKTREHIEVPKDYILRNYSLVDEYEDEYDDTYDTSDTRAIMQDDATEVGSRSFTTPRVLCGKPKVETVDESESEDEDVETEQIGKHFIKNPEEVRAEAEQRRQAMQGRRSTANAIGKSKGKGQENNVSHNKQQKTNQKSERKHHNQRSGASWKRRNGMVPS